ncbi:unnamed protein product [Tetraodon nigroviridis]|uniref:(spotted green pufferfish) hypothetical protein n=1 Tax=Tetraodon nigroviridis TaxID=99883 RepID=Q4TAI7_TETNG|nr:unnamed protein product [Tetraodon nigroviridis]
MKTEVSIQLLKFCFQVFNCILLVSGTWDTGEDPGSDVDLRLSPVPLQVLGVSVLSCSLWILFSPGNLLNVLPSDEVGVVGLGLLLIGGSVLLVSLVGCIGAHGEKVLLLMVVSSVRALAATLTCGQLRDRAASSSPVPGSAHRAGPGSAVCGAVAGHPQRPGEPGRRRPAEKNVLAVFSESHSSCPLVRLDAAWMGRWTI